MADEDAERSLSPDRVTYVSPHRYRVAWRTKKSPGAAVSVDGVIDNELEKRFELPFEGLLAVSYYHVDGDRITLLHTEVPPQLSGRGVGSRLAHGTFEMIRQTGRRVIAKCPFMAAYAARHPEYLAMLDG